MPKVAVIAGPNGSGKTTFYYSKLRSQFPNFVNADELALSIEGMTSTEALNIAAANRAEALRQELMLKREDFAFETVFSRSPYWLEYLGALKEAGYEIWLFFICTDSPLLNVTRVEARVELGGHGVPAAKVVSRYAGSIQTAIGARALVDQLWLYDNTERDRDHRLVFRYVRGSVDFVSTTLPSWM